MDAPALRVASPPADFKIRSIDHTGITVSSLDEALDFWVGVLGFTHQYTWSFEPSTFIAEMLGVPGAALRLAMVQGPGHLVELLEYSAPDDRKVYKPRACDVGSVHLAFYVDNLDALLERVSAAGWHAVGQVQKVDEGDRLGLRLIYVRGPDGVMLEFLEPPPTTPVP